MDIQKFSSPYCAHSIPLNSVQEKMNVKFCHLALWSQPLAPSWLQILYGDPLRADGLSSTWVNNPLQITDRLWVPVHPQGTRVMHNKSKLCVPFFQTLALGSPLCSHLLALWTHIHPPFPSSASVFPPVKGAKVSHPLGSRDSGDTVDVDSVSFYPRMFSLPPVCFVLEVWLLLFLLFALLVLPQCYMVKFFSFSRKLFRTIDILKSK